MKYVSLSRKRRGQLTATGLDGGLNRRDLPVVVADNQLTVCRNFWWRDGVLRSRPGLRLADSASPEGERVYGCGDDGRFLMRRTTAGLVTGVVQQNGVPEWNTQTLPETGHAWRVRFDAARLPGWSAGETDGTLVFRADGTVVAPLAAGGYAALDGFIHVPQLLTGGAGAATLFDAPPAGTRTEARNLLTAAFRASYTTDGEGKFFYLPVEQVDGTHPIVAVYQTGSGTAVTHTIAAGALCETTAAADGLCMAFSAYRRCVFFTLPGGAEQQAPAAAGVSDNLTVTAYAAGNEASVIGGMQFGCWFGGASSGLVAGTRLFVAGNPAVPSRMYWSDTGNPLYFPADQYTDVGDAASAVTAFAQQGEQLIVFKEHELYAVSCVAGTVTADDPAGMKLSLSPLHAAIGCDCPATVRLCRNRLVWATSEGRVYTLVTKNAFSQSNVRVISGQIEPELRGILPQNMQKASAGYRDGWYLLLADGRLLLLRCEDTAFEKITSYVGDELAAHGMTWYCWEFDGLLLPERLVSWEKQTVILDTAGHSYVFGGTADRVLYGGTVTERPISCALCTKAFDFGYADWRKTVREVMFDLGTFTDSTVTVTYVSDRGRMRDHHRFFAAARDSGSPGFLHTCRLLPNASRVRRLALEIATEGAVAIGALTVRYDIDTAAEKGMTLYGGEL